jgi:hypothetical protein
VEIRNFKLIETRGKNPLDWEYFATVDAITTTGALWWKKEQMQTRKIRKKFGGSWHFVDTGEFTPGQEVENMARAWEASTGEAT